jgi:glycosyltransferase involved in cell wall biosynthesis
MKVLFFVSSEIGSKNGSIGGDVAQIIGIINGFKKLGHDVLYVSRNPHKYLDNNEYHFENIKYSNLNVPKMRGLLNQRAIVKAIEYNIHKYSPSLIYCFWPSNPFISRLRKYKVPIVMICNTPRSMKRKHFIARYYDKLNLQTATVVSAVSEEITSYFKESFDNKISSKVTTNPNGADIERFIQQQNNIRKIYNIPSDLPLIGFAGYFAPWHRIDILIKAVQKLKDEAKLLLIGTGSEKIENELKSLARERFPERVIFTGPVPFHEIPKYYSACDILCVAQDKDRPHGSSMKLLEYMSMGKAIAAANVGQLGQNIQNEKNGLLFEPDEESLVKTLTRLIQDPSLRDKLGKAAREDAVEHFSWQANIMRVLKILNL